MRFGWLAVLAGCFSPAPPPGVPCSSISPCPTGQRCVGGTCDGESDQPGGDAPVTPPNDGPGNGNAKCAAAIPIGLNDEMVIGSLAGATDDFDPPSGCGGDGIEVVYVFTVPNGGAPIQMSVTSPDFTGRYYMAQTCPPTDFTSCGSISNLGGGSTSSTYDAGKAYLVIERGANSTGTSFTIRP